MSVSLVMRIIIIIILFRVYQGRYIICQLTYRFCFYLPFNCVLMGFISFCTMSQSPLSVMCYEERLLFLLSSPSLSLVMRMKGFWIWKCLRSYLVILLFIRSNGKGRWEVRFCPKSCHTWVAVLEIERGLHSQSLHSRNDTLLLQQALAL